jgi:tetratricopeptide (TPR) repeat protein
VFDFEWVDSCAAARNEALSHATGDYAFWLDADDEVEPGEREKLLRQLRGLSHSQDAPAAYVVRCACAPSPDGKKGATVVDHVRLFPILPGVRWAYRVHEQILPSLKRANIAVRWTDLTVRHTGYLDPDVEARKLDRNIRLLKLEVAERPDDPFVLFNLGMSAVERRELPEALAYLTRSLAGSASSDSIVCKLFALIARTHQMMGDSQAALATCARGLESIPEDAELWFRKGVVHRHRGESSEAERCWRLIFTLARPDQFRSVDPGILPRTAQLVFLQRVNSRRRHVAVVTLVAVIQASFHNALAARRLRFGYAWDALSGLFKRHAATKCCSQRYVRIVICND